MDTVLRPVAATGSLRRIEFIQPGLLKMAMVNSLWMQICGRWLAKPGQGAAGLGASLFYLFGGGTVSGRGVPVAPQLHNWHNELTIAINLQQQYMTSRLQHGAPAEGRLKTETPVNAGNAGKQAKKGAEKNNAAQTENAGAARLQSEEAANLKHGSIRPFIAARDMPERSLLSPPGSGIKKTPSKEAGRSGGQQAARKAMPKPKASVRQGRKAEAGRTQGIPPVQGLQQLPHSASPGTGRIRPFKAPGGIAPSGVIAPAAYNALSGLAEAISPGLKPAATTALAYWHQSRIPADALMRPAQTDKKTRRGKSRKPGILPAGKEQLEAGEKWSAQSRDTATAGGKEYEAGSRTAMHGYDNITAQRKMLLERPGRSAAAAFTIASLSGEGASSSLPQAVFEPQRAWARAMTGGRAADAKPASDKTIFAAQSRAGTTMPSAQSRAGTTMPSAQSRASTTIPSAQSRASTTIPSAQLRASAAAPSAKLRESTATPAAQLRGKTHLTDIEQKQQSPMQVSRNDTIGGSDMKYSAISGNIPGGINAGMRSIRGGMVAGDRIKSTIPGIYGEAGGKTAAGIGIIRADMRYLTRREPGIVSVLREREDADMVSQSLQRAAFNRSSAGSLFYRPYEAAGAASAGHGAETGNMTHMAAPGAGKIRKVEHKPPPGFKKVDMSIKKPPGQTGDATLDTAAMTRLVNQVYEQFERKVFLERRRLGL